MKDYLKNELKHLPMMILICAMFYGITTFATNYVFDSGDVRFDNTGTEIQAGDVQGAIDETFHHVTDYNDIKTTIGNNALTTTNKTLIGAINEVNSNIARVQLTTATDFNNLIVGSENAHRNMYYAGNDLSIHSHIPSGSWSNKPFNLDIETLGNGYSSQILSIYDSSIGPRIFKRQSYYSGTSASVFTSWEELALNSSLNNIGKIYNLGSVANPTSDSTPVEGQLSESIKNYRFYYVGVYYTSNGYIDYGHVFLPVSDLPTEQTPVYLKAINGAAMCFWTNSTGTIIKAKTRSEWSGGASLPGNYVVVFGVK